MSTPFRTCGIVAQPSTNSKAQSNPLNGVFWSTEMFEPKPTPCKQRAGDGDRTRDVQLGKLAVVKASNQKKALADFQGEPRRASADSSTSTASWRLWRAATV